MGVIFAGVIVGIVLLATNNDDNNEPDTTTIQSETTTLPTTTSTTRPPTGEVFQFPASFKIGAASASYQIEGAWDADGKSPNIWDTITHNNPSYVADSSNGDVAADSYNMYEKDLDALSNIGVCRHRSSDD